MLVLEEEDPAFFAFIEEKNLLRQYDLLANCIDIGLRQGPQALDMHMVWALNHVAVANIAQFGGRFREEPIYVGNHNPPPFKEVQGLMDRFFAFVHANWYAARPTTLAAYALWRLNWIHPFVEGNGRTARAVCYYILCVRSGGWIRGRRIVPERIRADRNPYVAALREADAAWHEGRLDVSALDRYLAGLLADQMNDRN